MLHQIGGQICLTEMAILIIAGTTNGVVGGAWMRRRKTSVASGVEMHQIKKWLMVGSETSYVMQSILIMVGILIEIEKEKERGKEKGSVNENVKGSGKENEREKGRRSEIQMLVLDMIEPGDLPLLEEEANFLTWVPHLPRWHLVLAWGEAEGNPVVLASQLGVVEGILRVLDSSMALR